MPKTITMLSPSGEVADIPAENAVAAAREGGYVAAVDMMNAKDNSTATIPLARAHDALISGEFTFKNPSDATLSAGASVPKPRADEPYDEKNTGSLGDLIGGKPGAYESHVNQTPGEVLGHLGKAAVATGAGVVGAGAAAEIGPVATAVTHFVTAHPIAVGFAYHIARELGVPLPKMLDLLSKIKE
jgi:uncharacterized protein YbjQ (UPF0145 family)